jgi:predicted metal-dependent peptidase
MFNQDIAALEKANDTFQFITLDAKILRNIATTFFPETVERYTIYNSVELAATRLRWRMCMDRFVQKLIKQYAIRAVLAPSDNFFYVRELIPALQNKQKDAL